MPVTEQEWATWAGDEYARVRIIQSGQLATDSLRYPVPASLREPWSLACQPLRKGTALALLHLAERHGFPDQVERWRLAFEACPGDPDEGGAWDRTWRSVCKYDPVLIDKGHAHHHPLTTWRRT